MSPAAGYTGEETSANAWKDGLQDLGEGGKEAGDVVSQVLNPGTMPVPGVVRFWCASEERCVLTDKGLNRCTGPFRSVQKGKLADTLCKRLPGQSRAVRAALFGLHAPHSRRVGNATTVICSSLLHSPCW